MKVLKMKVLAVLMVLAIAIAPMTAFAATGINANEQAVLDAAKAAVAGYTLNASQQAKANSMIGQVETYFKGDVDLTDAEKNTVVGQIDAIVAAVPNKDLSKVSINDLYKNTPTISAAVNKVAEALGVTISIGSGSVTITDKGGNTVADSKDPVKQTGVQVEYLVFAALGFAALIAGCVVVAKKKNLFSAA